MANEDLREIRIDPIVPSLSVLIATARGKRPHTDKEDRPEHDYREYVDGCPFCPGNEKLTPPAILEIPSAESSWQVRIVKNLYPVLDHDFLPPGVSGSLQQAMEGYGHHEVIIDHAAHGITLQQMSEGHLTLLFAVYRDRMRFLYQTDPRVRYVLVFKNYGKAAGGSIPHTHSQMIAMPIVPHNVHDEIEGSESFYKKTGHCVFCTLLDTEVSMKTTSYTRSAGKEQKVYETGSYLVERGDHFAAIKPFASRYEWEIHILPISHQCSFLEVSDEVLPDLSRVLSRTMRRLQAMVGEVQYNFFIHSLPYEKEGSNLRGSFHWHLEICPRTSIPSGFELGSGLFVNTMSPEMAAARLREVNLENS